MPEANESREPGYYWGKNAHGNWQVYEWDGFDWFQAVYDSDYGPASLNEERIKNPDEQDYADSWRNRIEHREGFL